MAVYGAPTDPGSKEHAEEVWKMATDLLRYLNKPLEGRDRLRNRFRPKVLTKVSRSENKIKKWSVGSSVAVSHFLRPLYLYNRIRHFKPSLKGAVIHNEPLETAETNAEWESEAFGGKGYETSKKPCQTCQSKFWNLQCFGESDPREFSSAQRAEYCPINQLLPQRPRQKMRLQGKSLTLPWDSSVKDVGFFMKTLEILHRFAGKRQILETLNTSAMHTKSM